MKPKNETFHRVLTPQGWEIRPGNPPAAEMKTDAGAEQAPGEIENIELKGAHNDKPADNSGGAAVAASTDGNTGTGGSNAEQQPGISNLEPERNTGSGSSGNASGKRGAGDPGKVRRKKG